MASALSATLAERGSSETDLLLTSFHDLGDDFEDLSRIAEATRSRLRSATEELRRARRHLHPVSAAIAMDQLRGSDARYAGWLEELVALRTRSQAGPRTEADLERLTRAKERVAHALRAEQSLAASLITATDWQSPSFGHVGVSTAGRYTGLVREHHDDYKRDRHADAGELENAYLGEYVDNPADLPLEALATGCGMSAFTTILASLALDRRLNRRVLVGRSTYHECRDLLERTAGGRCLFVEEADTADILEKVRRFEPSAIFLDSLCNAKGLAVPDLRSILRRLAAAPPRQELLVVVDNTGLSCTFQPWGILRPDPVRLVVFESLTKYAQFGFDRTAAGVVVVESGALAESLSVYREHLGTNLSDVAAHAVPRPNRSLLDRRLRRLERNTRLLAYHLEAMAQGDRVFEGISYPGLPGHPSHAVARSLSFSGGFFSFEFRPEHDRPDAHRALLDAMLEEARRHGVRIAAGASFGLDTTRVYVTSTSSRAFVRVSPGTEHRLQVEGLKAVFGEAMRRVARLT